MFRPTHFVILFAVVLCAVAMPADPAKPTPEGLAKIPDAILSQKQPTQGSESKVKGDLDTDAQTYWAYRYTYNTPTLGYIAPGLVARTYNYAPYSWYYGLPSAPLIIQD